jgi:hypothetical protein
MTLTNQAIDINTLSRRVFAHGKASKRRCSTECINIYGLVSKGTSLLRVIRDTLKSVCFLSDRVKHSVCLGKFFG